MKDRPQTIVQEDKAPSHAHHAQAAVYSLQKVIRLLWTANSPDLNMIEPCWGHLKRITIEKGAPKSREEAAKPEARSGKILNSHEFSIGLNKLRDILRR